MLRKTKNSTFTLNIVGQADGILIPKLRKRPALCASFLEHSKYQNIIKTGQIFLTTLLIFAISCNSNTTFKEEVLKNIPIYENSANEILTHFDTLAKLHQWHDTIFRSTEIYSSQIVSSENIVERKDLQLQKTKVLTSRNLAQYIFLNSDTSVYYNIYNSETSIIKSYRHFFCFTPNHGTIKFDMINHGYKIIKTKSISDEWRYVILKVGFD